MSELEDRLRRFAYEWHEAMNSPYAVNMMPMLLKAASDVRRLVAPSLEADNDKLRELVKDLYTDMWDSGEWLEPYEQRMRELGIEVDG